MLVRFPGLRKFLATRENTSTITTNAIMMPLCRRFRVSAVRSAPTARASAPFGLSGSVTGSRVGTSAVAVIVLLPFPWS